MNELLNEGYRLLNECKYDQAEEFIRKAIDWDINDLQAIGLLVHLLMDTDRCEEANLLYQWLATIANVEVVLAGVTMSDRLKEKCIDFRENALSLDGLFDEGYSFLEDGNYDKAIEKFKVYLEKLPLSVSAICNLKESLRRRRKGTCVVSCPKCKKKHEISIFPSDYPIDQPRRSPIGWLYALTFTRVYGEVADSERSIYCDGCFQKSTYTFSLCTKCFNGWIGLCQSDFVHTDHEKKTIDLVEPKRETISCENCGNAPTPITSKKLEQRIIFWRYVMNFVSWLQQYLKMPHQRNREESKNIALIEEDYYFAPSSTQQVIHKEIYGTEEIKAVSEFPLIEVLKLEGTSRLDIDLSPLRSLSRCKAIVIKYNPNVADLLIKIVDSIPSLEDLHMKALKSVELLDLSILKRLPQLKTLVIQSSLKGIDISPLSSLAHLKELIIWLGHGASLKSGSRPFETEERIRLHIGQFQPKQVKLEPLYGKLELLYIAELGISQISPGILQDVEELWIMRTYIESIDLSPISSSVREIDLSSNRLKSIDLTPLASCTTLKELNLSENQLRNLDIAPLTSCANLAVLNVGRNNLQSLDLAPLASCTDLTRLSLHHNQLNELDLAPLASCVNLKVLNLGHNNLQSIDLGCLKNCKKLEYLNLAGINARELDLSVLHDLSPQLEVDFDDT
jgi:Leucine-rich repeat (LRR) protein